MTRALYARTLSASTRHIINPDNRVKTLCGSLVAVPELYVDDDGSFRVAGRTYTYDLAPCQRCDRSAAKLRILPDRRVRSIESAELMAYASESEGTR